MFRNALSAALGNLARNRLYAAISVAGLALGLTAVILTGLFIRDELSFDRFIPGHDQVQVITTTVAAPGQAEAAMDYAPAKIAAWLRPEIPQIERVARLAYDQATLRRGEVEAREDVAWVDPDFFAVLPLPTLAGDPGATVRDADGVVITRAMARKYFGRDAPLGETLTIDRQPMRVGAVIADLPSATHLTQQVFASGRAAFSSLSKLGAAPGSQGFLSIAVTRHPGQSPDWTLQYVRTRIYVQIRGEGRLRAAAAQLADFGARHAAELKGLPDGSQIRFGLVPLTGLHLQAFKGANLGATDPRGSSGALYALGIIAALVLGLAAINFVNLTTARAGLRAVEVGIRKASGARRRHLAAQFMGEALIHATVAVVLAVALVELILPFLNAALMRQISFAYWREPALLAALVGATVAVGGLAGAYPALVLSGFRPAAVLKGGPVETAGSGRVRQGLVVAQFAVLVVLILAVSVVWSQTRYALGEGLRIDKAQVLAVYATPCRGAFADEVRRLPGVSAAVCSSRSLLGLEDFDPAKYVMDAAVPGGPTAHINLGAADFGLFEFYGVRPLAGRLFRPDAPGDDLPRMRPGVLQQGSMILNASAARQVGFADPARIVGRTVAIGPGAGDFTVVGVVPDVTLDLLNAEVKPTAYLVDFLNYPAEQVLNVRLTGRDITATLAAIDRLWTRTGRPGAIHRQFVDDYVEQIYRGTVRQGWLVAALSGVALFLAGFGLLGLAAFTAERRTKEIGVRKAMGASTADILKLLMWQFTKPVLWANLIAWPVAWLAMDWWLKGFAYHVSLGLPLFAAAAAAALAVAWSVVFVHALRVARTRPVGALRHE